MYKDILLQLLDITDYKGNKDEFVADFNHVTSSQALVTLVASLPDKKREEADNAIAAADSHEAFNKTVHKYFSDEQIQVALDDASAQAITQWIQSIAPTLNADQKQKLVELSDALEKKIKTTKKS